MFALRAEELLKIADISRVSRDGASDLIGYQRPEVKKHVQNIVEYLNIGTGRVLFPNSIILALVVRDHLRRVAWPKVDQHEIGEAGTIDIPIPRSPARPSRPGSSTDSNGRSR